MERVLVLDVQYADDVRKSENLPTKAQIKKWIIACLVNSMSSAQLTVRIAGMQESQRLNEKYRHKKGPTNVLSFPFEQPDWLQPPLLGDLVICADLVAQEAKEQGKVIEAHWAHLVIHGVVHLLGYDHETTEQARVMEDQERVIMVRLGYLDPYTDNMSRC